jgi:hypothetical protein
MMSSQAAMPQKDRPWEEAIRKGRKGASYFLSLVNILQASPEEYYDSRDMESASQKAVMQEWEGWMATFGNSKYKVLVDLSRRTHNHTQAAKKHLLKKALTFRKFDMLVTSRDQLRNNEAEMTSLLQNGKHNLTACFVSLSQRHFKPNAYVIAVPLSEYLDTPGMSVQTAGKMAHDLQNEINAVSSGKLLYRNGIKECNQISIQLLWSLELINGFLEHLVLDCISFSSGVEGHNSRVKLPNDAPVFRLKRRESNIYEDELEDTAVSSTPSRSSTKHCGGKNEQRILSEKMTTIKYINSRVSH